MKNKKALIILLFLLSIFLLLIFLLPSKDKIKGTYFDLENFEAFWQSAKDTDFNQLFPVFEITLDKKETRTGILLIYLYDNKDKERIIGDPIYINIKEGKFAKTQSNKINISSTAKILKADFSENLLNSEKNRWFFSILEASNREQFFSSEKEFLLKKIPFPKKVK